MINYTTKLKTEYTNKKWDLETMKIKFKNLEKIIPFITIHTRLSINKMYAKSELDAYYLTYFELKDMFLKYKRSSFGDTSKNVKKAYELNWEDISNEQLIDATINNSIYGCYNVYDSYTTSLVGYDGRIIGY